MAVLSKKVRKKDANDRKSSTSQRISSSFQLKFAGVDNQQIDFSLKSHRLSNLLSVHRLWTRVYRSRLAGFFQHLATVISIAKQSKLSSEDILSK